MGKLREISLIGFNLLQSDSNKLRDYDIFIVNGFAVSVSDVLSTFDSFLPPNRVCNLVKIISILPTKELKDEEEEELKLY